MSKNQVTENLELYGRETQRIYNVNAKLELLRAQYRIVSGVDRDIRRAAMRETANSLHIYVEQAKKRYKRDLNRLQRGLVTRDQWTAKWLGLSMVIDAQPDFVVVPMFFAEAVYEREYFVSGQRQVVGGAYCYV